MRIPRKKEEPEQPIIVSRITRLLAWYELTKEIKQRNWKLRWRTMYMNENIARSRTRGSPRWREKTMMITCSSKPDIPLHESLYHPQYPSIGVLHQMNAKTVLQSNWTKSVWRATSRLWGILERDPCMQMEEDNLVENLQCTTEAWWRFSITEILLRRLGWWISNPWQRSHDDRRSVTWICSSLSLATVSWANGEQKMNPIITHCIDQSYMKPSEKTSVPERPKYIEIKHYTLRDEVQKRESGSPIYISTDEQTFWCSLCPRWKSLCTQVGARGDDFLIEKGRYDS